MLNAKTQVELEGKQDALISGSNIKTINGNSILGSGNLNVSGGTGSGSGATGPTGPQGTAGNNGAQGIQGTAGTNGITGPTGPQGTAGSNGATGPTGAQGTAGAQGAQGTAGTNAILTGATGPSGPTGPQGTAGTQGIQGTAGVNGSQGTAGSIGTTGPTGSPLPRVASTTSSATPTPNADTTDFFELTAQTATSAFQVISGTPTNGQKIMIGIYSLGTAQPLTWSSATGGYIGGIATLPTTTVTSKHYTIGFRYVTANSLNKWMSIGQFSQV